MKLWIAVLVLTIAISSLRADDAPRVQVFGGYSVGSLQAPITGVSLYRGWNASVEHKAFGKLSAISDFAGYYGTENEVVNNRVHSFLFGPKLTLRDGRFSPFIHALFGVSRMSAESGGPAFTSNAFTFGAGLGVDLRISRRFAIRLVQADYIRRRFFGEGPDGVRASGGIVYRFGE